MPQDATTPPCTPLSGSSSHRPAADAAGRGLKRAPSDDDLSASRETKFVASAAASGITPVRSSNNNCAGSNALTPGSLPPPRLHTAAAAALQAHQQQSPTASSEPHQWLQPKSEQDSSSSSIPSSPAPAMMMMTANLQDAVHFQPIACAPTAILAPALAAATAAAAAAAAAQACVASSSSNSTLPQQVAVPTATRAVKKDSDLTTAASRHEQQQQLLLPLATAHAVDPADDNVLTPLSAQVDPPSPVSNFSAEPQNGEPRTPPLAHPQVRRPTPTAANPSPPTRQTPSLEQYLSSNMLPLPEILPFAPPHVVDEYQCRMRREVDTLVVQAEDAALPLLASFEDLWGLAARHDANNNDASNINSDPENLLRPMEQEGLSADNFFTGREYSRELMYTMRQAEADFTVIQDFMEGQPEISPRMRAILVDWMLEVRLELHLSNETFYLAVNILDRFLELVDTARDTLQLVGLTAMFVAAKHEETVIPVISDWLYMCDGQFQQEHLLHMELMVLDNVRFRLNVPTTFLSLMKFISGTSLEAVDQRILYQARYFCDLASVSYSFVPVRPSMLSASALLLARMSCLPDGDEPLWSDLHQRVTGYSATTLMPFVILLADLAQRVSHLPATAVRNLYRGPGYHSVASLPVTVRLL
ncbi:hypothetical protein CAOG_01199 [Capsaspora owczarzaki ATCC 30864]|uniref:Uncharacterized protein n=1 Tax=Capsaspora owczarzaki (strain ATCC 30864) TaxID=595528 RepID=A0A0D2WIQ8_CAPO3|nr:hypothetical protein CAOG_01199 [Capsaspora owczarzaki ATCC 30864]KJE89770.1 hypothetical protein CAOG_001199 [Capsaspora owczarzaki ATCC 30864]|eukprot:XP_004349696.2 hypothetical protein CAOG_01199 [Capsaspora owczarzaki ATCC 30864]